MNQPQVLQSWVTNDTKNPFLKITEENVRWNTSNRRHVGSRSPSDQGSEYYEKDVIEHLHHTLGLAKLCSYVHRYLLRLYLSYIFATWNLKVS